MKREKHLTRRERQALNGGPRGPNPSARRSTLQPGAHIHCVACGRHLQTVGEAETGPRTWSDVTCAHGSVFQACTSCVGQARVLLDDHDRTGQAVRAAAAWH
jgi:hypothetical protein